jgi:ferric-dicitrate binding protein FerR (iron transport regulator)
MNPKISPELLKKYIRGEASPEESEQIDKWYASFESKTEDPHLTNSIELEEKLLSQIKAKIGLSESTSIKRKGSSSPFLGTALKWAASFTIVGLIGAAIYQYLPGQSEAIAERTPVENPSVEKFANNTAAISEHRLSDGSVVQLQPNSVIEFPHTFDPFRRDVKLTGEAFFDVSKDKNRPFVITTGGVTIKVLGTSFNVKAYNGADQITVAVKTGKVLVTKSEKSSDDSEGSKEEIILTPNQEVVYNTVNENFERKLVDEPAIILTKPTLFEMKYDGTPVDKIFEVLEENYGIDIVFDEVTMANCTLTTSMAEEGLYERIEIICKAIGAEYQITDSTILITSKGCR